MALIYLERKYRRLRSTYEVAVSKKNAPEGWVLECIIVQRQPAFCSPLVKQTEIRVNDEPPIVGWGDENIVCRSKIHRPALRREGDTPSRKRMCGLDVRNRRLARSPIVSPPSYKSLLQAQRSRILPIVSHP